MLPSASLAVMASDPATSAPLQTRMKFATDADASPTAPPRYAHKTSTQMGVDVFEKDLDIAWLFETQPEIEEAKVDQAAAFTGIRQLAAATARVDRALSKHASKSSTIDVFAKDLDISWLFELEPGSAAVVDASVSATTAVIPPSPPPLRIPDAPRDASILESPLLSANTATPSTALIDTPSSCTSID